MGGDDVATRGTPGAVGRWACVTGSSPENPKAARPRGALDAEPLTPDSRLLDDASRSPTTTRCCHSNPGKRTQPRLFLEGKGRSDRGRGGANIGEGLVIGQVKQKGGAVRKGIAIFFSVCSIRDFTRFGSVTCKNSAPRTVK